MLDTLTPKSLFAGLVFFDDGLRPIYELPADDPHFDTPLRRLARTLLCETPVTRICKHRLAAIQKLLRDVASTPVLEGESAVHWLLFEEEVQWLITSKELHAWLRSRLLNEKTLIKIDQGITELCDAITGELMPILHLRATLSVGRDAARWHVERIGNLQPEALLVQTRHALIAYWMIALAQSQPISLLSSYLRWMRSVFKPLARLGAWAMARRLETTLEAPDAMTSRLQARFIMDLLPQLRVLAPDCLPLYDLESNLAFALCLGPVEDEQRSLDPVLLGRAVAANPDHVSARELWDNLTASDVSDSVMQLLAKEFPAAKARELQSQRQLAEEQSATEAPDGFAALPVQYVEVLSEQSRTRQGYLARLRTHGALWMYSRRDVFAKGAAVCGLVLALTAGVRGGVTHLSRALIEHRYQVARSFQATEPNQKVATASDAISAATAFLSSVDKDDPRREEIQAIHDAAVLAEAVRLQNSGKQGAAAALIVRQFSKSEP